MLSLTQITEHFTKVTVRCMRSRRQNIARALNFSDTQGLLAAPMGTDLFGGQWPKLHAEEQARKKATQEAQKLLKGSQPGQRGGRGNSSVNQQPFHA